jgi:hypothetical protein
MARFIGDGTSGRLTSSPPITVEPLTMACWFRQSAISGTAVSRLMSLSRSDSNNYWSLNTFDAALQLAAVGTSVGAVSINAGGSLTANTWHHAAGVFTSNTSRAVLLDGGGKTTNTSNVVHGATVDHFGIGTQYFSGSLLTNNACDMIIANAAIWDVALTDDEIACLAKGFSPRTIRRAALIAHWPLVGRFSPELELAGAIALTLTNSPTQADHPRIIPPPISIRRRRLSRHASPVTAPQRKDAREDNSAGTKNWLGLDFIAVTDTSDAAQASGDANDTVTTHYLVLDLANLRPPATATIVGMEVSWYSWTNYDTSDEPTLVITGEAFPVQNGVVQTGSPKTLSSPMDKTRNQDTLGGSTDDWGVTWAPGDKPGFALQYTMTDAGGFAMQIRVNQPAVTIWFSDGTSVKYWVHARQPSRIIGGGIN